MMDANEPLPTNKPEPMKKMDWLLLGILVLLFVISFPILWRLYRFLIPIAVLVFIFYFGFRIFQLGKNTLTVLDTSTGNQLSSIWMDIVNGIRKTFRTIAVASIITIVASVISILLYQQYSRQRVTEKQLSRMSQALEKYKNAYGRYPSNLEELIGNDPLKREWTEDSWGNPVIYTITKGGEGVSLKSSGADGKPGNDDDINVSI